MKLSFLLISIANPFAHLNSLQLISKTHIAGGQSLTMPLTECEIRRRLRSHAPLTPLLKTAAPLNTINTDEWAHIRLRPPLPFKCQQKYQKKTLKDSLEKNEGKRGYFWILKYIYSSVGKKKLMHSSGGKIAGMALMTVSRMEHNFHVAS